MGARKMHEGIQNTGMTKKMIKTPFSTTQQATNFNNVQIELVPVITATKLFLRNRKLLCLFYSYLSDALPLPTKDRNREAIGD